MDPSSQPPGKPRRRPGCNVGRRCGKLVGFVGAAGTLADDGGQLVHGRRGLLQRVGLFDRARSLSWLLPMAISCALPAMVCALDRTSLTSVRRLSFMSQPLHHSADLVCAACRDVAGQIAISHRCVTVTAFLSGATMLRVTKKPTTVLATAAASANAMIRNWWSGVPPRPRYPGTLHLPVLVFHKGVQGIEVLLLQRTHGKQGMNWASSFRSLVDQFYKCRLQRLELVPNIDDVLEQLAPLSSVMMRSRVAMASLLAVLTCFDLLDLSLDLFSIGHDQHAEHTARDFIDLRLDAVGDIGFGIAVLDDGLNL